MIMKKGRKDCEKLTKFVSDNMVSLTAAERFMVQMLCKCVENVNEDLPQVSVGKEKVILAMT